MSRSRLFLAAVGLCAALGFASQGSAADALHRDSLSARTVRYADADLHSADGAKRLAQRLRYAADFVCGGDNIVLRSGSRFYSCRRQVLERAVAELNAPLVTAALGGSAGPILAGR